MKRKICLLLAVVTLLSLCSCELAPNDIRITMGVLDEVSDTDPLNADGDVENIIAANCFEGLMHIDAQGETDLGGATAYTVENDGLKYTFKLNPSARWYIPDETKSTLKELNIEINEKITASDFIYGIKRFILSRNTALNSIDGAAELASGKSTALGVKALDDYTLEITLAKADPDFLYKLATNHVYPCNEAFEKAMGEKYGSSPDTLIYNGPYYLKSTTASESLIAVNPDYKGKTQVKNAEVLLYFTGTAENLNKRFNDGTYDIICVSNDGVVTLRSDNTEGIYSVDNGRLIYFHGGEKTEA